MKRLNYLIDFLTPNASKTNAEMSVINKLLIN